MAVILTPDKWRRQPSGPVGVDWSNPITRGLSYAAVNGVEHVSRAPSGMTQVSVSPDGFTERGAIAYRAAADVAACTIIGHVTFTSDNADYAGLEWGYFVSASDCSQLAIGFGDAAGAASGDIYAVNRANGTGSTVLETDVSLPYVAVLAMTGTLGSGASATAYKNGSVLGTVTQSGAAGFATDTRRQFRKFTASSTGKESAWCYKFNRVLSAQEIASLSAFPWQIFRKQPRILYFTAAGGGTSYDGAVSEALAATSTQGPLVDWLGTTSESAGITTTQGNTWSGDVTATMTLAVTTAASGALETSQAVSESLAIVTAQAQDGAITMTVSETIAATSAEAGIWSGSAAVTESAALTSSESAVATFAVSVGEAIAAVVAQWVAGATVDASVSESLAATTTLSATVELGGIVAETLAATDAVGVISTETGSVTMALAIADAAIGGLVSTLAVTEAVSISTSADGSVITAEFVTPDGRTLRVSFDARTLEVRKQPRTLLVSKSLH